jgi:hypothetical protein
MMSLAARLQPEHERAGTDAGRIALENLASAALAVEASASALRADALIRIADATTIAERVDKREIAVELIARARYAAGWTAGFAAGLAARRLRAVR